MNPNDIMLFGQKFRADPYPTYAQMRAKMPVCGRTNPHDGTTTWFVTRYDDVVSVLRDHKRFVKNYRNSLTSAEQEALAPDPPMLRLVSNHMLNMDPPDHTRLRALVNKAFTTSMVEQLETRMQQIADELIDKVIERGQMDLIHDYAFPLPVIVIAEMLGVPTRDRGRFRNWSHAIVTPTPNAERTAQKLAKTRQLMEDFIAYLRKISAQRRQKPGDDLLTSLLLAEDAGDRLSEDELFSMVLLLIVVGHETSVNLIGNGLLSLFKHPDQMALLQQKSGQEPNLLPLAVEEMLRYDCPVERAPMRFAAEDVRIGDQLIRRGDSVSLVLGSANRDETIFDRPDTFDIQRSPNKHLAFGLGVHYCLGAPLARLEGRVAVETLLRRLPNIQLAMPVEKLRWGTNPIMRGVHRMPVKWSIQ
jgi:cytochrome P450